MYILKSFLHSFIYTLILKSFLHSFDYFWMHLGWCCLNSSFFFDTLYYRDVAMSFLWCTTFFPFIFLFYNKPWQKGLRSQISAI